MTSTPTTSQLIFLGVTEFLTKKIEAHNSMLSRVVNPPTVFSGKLPVQISPSRYIKGLVKNFETSTGVVVIMLIYIERLLEKMACEYMAIGGKNQILFTSYNAHRIILTAYLISQKYCEDRTYRVASIARSGGIDREELIFLESEFLNFIDFNLYVDQETFTRYAESAVVFSRHLLQRQQP
jgi:hypothetical protein